jgi:hypothetical protein
MYERKSAPAPPYSSGTQTQLRQSRQQLARKRVRAIPVGRVRLDLLVREVARKGLDLALICGELEVHWRRLYRTGV